jgi:hypothetical protein
MNCREATDKVNVTNSSFHLMNGIRVFRLEELTCLDKVYNYYVPTLEGGGAVE